MKVIIAGSRKLHPIDSQIRSIIKQSGFEVTELVSGNAEGIDKAGEGWAQLENTFRARPPVSDPLINITRFPARWSDITAPGAIVRYNRAGRPYNVKAGFERNQKMAEYADALIAIWDGKSRGTADMIRRMEKLGKPVFKFIIKEEDE